jgi:hypothetical protein
MADNIIIKPYRLTVSNHVAHAADVYYKPLISFPGIITYPLIALFVAGLITAPSLMKGEYAGTILWAFGFISLIFIVIPGISLWHIWKSTKASPTATGLRTLQADGNGVRVQGEGFEAHLTWQSFKKVVETKSYVSLMRSGEAHIIPNSAFYTSADAKIFAEQARSHLANVENAQTAVFYDEQPTVHKSGHTDSDSLQSPPFVIGLRAFACLLVRVNLSLLYNPFTAICLFIIWIAVYSWLYRYDLMDGYWADALRAASTPVAIYLLTLLLLIALPWQMNRKAMIVTKARHVAISPEHIHATGHGFDVRLNWRDLKRLEIFAGVILFYTNPRGAIPLPTSAFLDKASAQAFYDQALVYFNAAKAAAKSTPDAKTLDGKS